MPPPPNRACFVTIGATASFRSLLVATTSDQFIDSLLSLGYTDLTLQCGPDLEYCRELLAAQAQNQQLDGSQSIRQKENQEISRDNHIDIKGLKIKMFDFNKMGLGQEMRVCQAQGGKRREGVVVCHAGAGTILDAMRIDVPIIVVPNPELLDNHQSELADELQRQGYVVYGDLSDLHSALLDIEKKSQARTHWNKKTANDSTSKTSPDVEETRKGIGSVVDEELGFEERSRVMEG